MKRGFCCLGMRTIVLKVSVHFLKNLGRHHWKQNTNFPKRFWIFSKNVFVNSAQLVSLALTKEPVWELAYIFLRVILRVSFSTAESRFGCAACQKLRLILDFLRRVFEISYSTKCWKKLSCAFFGNVVFVVFISVQSFRRFSYKSLEVYRPIAQQPKHISF